jgi:hypothetical protein
MTQVQRLAFLLMAAAALWPAIVPAQDSATEAKPNFSGRWRMVKEKSKLAGFHVPDIVVQVVEQRGKTMNVHTVETTGRQTTTADVSYFIDGSPSTNVIHGRQAESKTFWDGNVLNVRTAVKDASGTEVLVMEDRWELSDNGDTLTRTSHDITPKGSVDMTLISVKEKSAS